MAMHLARIADVLDCCAALFLQAESAASQGPTPFYLRGALG